MACKNGRHMEKGELLLLFLLLLLLLFLWWSAAAHPQPLASANQMKREAAATAA